MTKNAESGDRLTCEECGTVLKVPMAREGEMFSCPKCHAVLVAPPAASRPKPQRHDPWHGLLEDMPERRFELPDAQPSQTARDDGIEWDLGNEEPDSFRDTPAPSAGPAPAPRDDDKPLDWDEGPDPFAEYTIREAGQPRRVDGDERPLDGDERDSRAQPCASESQARAARQPEGPGTESTDEDRRLDWEDADDDPLAGVVPPAIAAQGPSGGDRDSAISSGDSGDLLWDDAASEAARRSPVDAAPARAPKPALPSIDEDAEFGVTCPLCGTRSYATLRQVGQTIRCPDCDSKFPVTAPKNPPRHKAAPAAESGAEFRLAETFERPAYQPLVKPLPPSDELDDDDDWWPRGKKRSRDGADGGGDETDPLGTAGDFFAFLARPDAIMIGVCIYVGLVLCTAFLTFATHPGELRLFGVLLGMTVFGVCACYLLVLVAKTTVGIVKDTANGARVVDDWPNWNVVDWIGEAGVGIASLLISTGPAALLSQFVCFSFMSDRESIVLAVFVTSMFVTALTHPFILLSILESGSVFAPISTNVARGLTKLPGTILMACVGAVGLGFLCGIELLLLAWGGYWGMIPLSALWVFTFYVYCRLVGLVGHHLRIGSEEEEYV